MKGFSKSFEEQIRTSSLDNTISKMLGDSIEEWLDQIYSGLITHSASFKQKKGAGSIIDAIKKEMFNALIPGPVFYILDASDFNFPIKIKNTFKNPPLFKYTFTNELPLYLTPCIDILLVPGRSNNINVKNVEDKFQVEFPFTISDLVMEQIEGDYLNLAVFCEISENTDLNNFMSLLRNGEWYIQQNDNKLGIEPELYNIFNDKISYPTELVNYQINTLIKEQSINIMILPIKKEFLEISDRQFSVFFKDTSNEVYRKYHYALQESLKTNHFLAWNIVPNESELLKIRGDYALDLSDHSKFGRSSELIDMTVWDENGINYCDNKTVLNPLFPYTYKIEPKEESVYNLYFKEKPSPPVLSSFKTYNPDDKKDRRELPRSSTISSLDFAGEKITFKINRKNEFSSILTEDFLMNFFKRKINTDFKWYTLGELEHACKELLSLLSLNNYRSLNITNDKIGRINGHFVPYIEIEIVHSRFSENNITFFEDAIQKYLTKGMAINSFLKVKCGN